MTQRGRHKRQSGGHGQFGDCVIEIKPQPRGAGFIFVDEIVGGVVPKQFIPSVEKGVIEYLKTGPLGFPVVDVCGDAERRLLSHRRIPPDAAFQTAARIGMQEGMPQCSPVLLEPIMHVQIHVPSDATAKVNARGQRPARPAARASTRAPAGTAGTRWRPRCRSRSSATSSSNCAR